MKKIATPKLVISGILSSLVFVITSFTMVRVPFAIVKQAYFHAGDSIIFLAGLTLGGYYAAIIAGIGSFLADLYLGASQYMLATLFIKGIMGGIAGYFLHFAKHKYSIQRVLLGLSLAGGWMAIAYYFFEVAFLGVNAVANLPNLLVNAAQAGVGILIYLPLSRTLLNSKVLDKYGNS